MFPLTAAQIAIVSGPNLQFYDLDPANLSTPNVLDGIAVVAGYPGHHECIPNKKRGPL
jgi:hypothetical protein